VFVKSQVESLIAAGVKNTVYEIEGWRGTTEYVKAVARIPRLAKARGAELVHAHFGYSAAASLGVSVPLIATFCGTDLLGRPDGRGGLTFKSRALARLSAHAARRADAVIVKSRQMRLRIADVPGVHVIPNGVRLTEVKREAKETARDALGWPREGKVLLFPADKSDARKNFALARAVERRLRGGGLDVRLEQMFGCPYSTVIRGMNAADVLLLPSLHEGSPNAVKDAMACGLPVVAAPVGDCEELLRDCWPSAVVERAEEAFTDATARMLAIGHRSNGRALIEDSFSNEAVAQRVIAVYEEVLRRPNAACPAPFRALVRRP